MIPPIRPLVAPAPLFLADDILRRRVRAELAEIREQLALPDAPAADLRVRSISDWLNRLIAVLTHPDQRRFPNPRVITDQFNVELVSILQGPGNIPLRAEFFNNADTLPIFRFLFLKMGNPNSIFFNERIQQPIEPEVPPDLLEQLRQIEALNARAVREAAPPLNRLEALRGRIQQREAALQNNIDRVARENLPVIQRNRDEVERLRAADLLQREERQRLAEREMKAAEDFRFQAAQLQNQLDNAQGQLGELQRSAAQLQVETNQLRSDIAKNKSNWLIQVASVCATIAVSWALKQPVIITF